MIKKVPYLNKLLSIILLLSLCRICNVQELKKEKLLPERELDIAIKNEMLQEKIPAISACIIKNDKIIWENAYGLANIEDSISAKNETVYLLASTSKLVIAIGVMQLHEREIINIDTDINEYLPFKVQHPKYPNIKITPRYLLTHRSALAWPHEEDPDFYEIHSCDTMVDLGNWLKNYIIPDGNNYHYKIWKDFMPGEYELYSNIGAALLGYLVEVASGKDFNTYCIQNIFEPLEMENTSFKVNDICKDLLAMPYYENLTQCGFYTVAFYPSTTLMSSTKEFSHLIIAVMNGGKYKQSIILTEESIKEMLRIQYNDSWLGLLWWKYKGGWYGGQGGFYGASSLAIFNKKDNLAILIFSNRTESETFFPPDGEIYKLIYNKAYIITR